MDRSILGVVRDSLLLSIAALGLACDDPGYRLEVRAFAEDDGALASGTSVVLRLRDHQVRGGSQELTVELGADVGRGDPVTLELPLAGGGNYEAHVLADGPGGRHYATRCYSIGGTTEVDVLLVGPLDDETDADGDGWSVSDDCRDPGGAACTDPCPPIRAVDCNDFDAGIHPTAVDPCQDQIDQDCSSSDALCGEDEGPESGSDQL